MEEEGYSVRTASDGEKALKVAKEFKPYLIITDLKMPVMDGMALLETYRGIDQDADFIVLTAHGTIDTFRQNMCAPPPPPGA